MAQVINRQLTADLQNGDVVISGSKDRVKLPRGSGPHIFKFQLTDNTDLDVHFSGFCAQPGEICPSEPCDDIPDQIEDVVIRHSTARFTDRNDNDGNFTFCYTWFFACDDGKQRPKFDPIVDNGGR